MWVPPKVDRELVEQRKEYEAQVLGLFHLRGGILDDWNRELAKIDPRLRLGQAVEKVPVGFPLVPGYYHLIRINEDAAPTTTPLHGPDFEFVEPSSQMLDKLREGDLQNPRAVAARKLREQEAENARIKREQIDKDERREELRERVDAVTRTQVLTSGDVPWSQNVAGAKGRRGGQGRARQS